ncbi:helix-turn-helix domain-containing protein [Rodentibacter genomosp. 2]|uniref:helix-turn-helix domain-containing protein n=1 Tax=Rodentibacter genomosp. 2 TaxID=1908266 RepID=UPI0015C2E0C1|nr:AraC family transcriptional regulator [Rodentibacter genomosp. 2]
MQQDSRISDAQSIFQLLRYQLYALIARLDHIATNLQQNHNNSRLSHRFYEFQDLLEQHFQYAHQVKFYAKQLVCSEKSLNRACQVARKTNAKTLITQRRILEAKRLLCHSELSIAIIAEQLSFTDLTHFSKVFKKETGVTPAMFKDMEK